MADTIRDAIFALLVNDTALIDKLEEKHPVGAEHIYHRSAPQDVDFPMVILSKQSGAPMYAFGDGPTSYFDNALWTVKGVDRGLSSEMAEDLDVLIHNVLQDADLVLENPDRTTMWFRREEDVDYGEREEGAVIHHVGAMYRLFTELT